MRHFLLIFPLFFTLLFSCGEASDAGDNHTDSTAVDVTPYYEYGIKSDSFAVVKGIIKKNEFLADILLKYNVPYPTIHEIAIKSPDVFDVRKIERGKEFTVYCRKDSSGQAVCFVYQPNELEYVVYDFRGDSISIDKGQKPVEIEERCITGMIDHSLYESLQDAGNNVMLAFEMAEIYAWTIDFYRLQKGDRFQVVYDERLVEGESIGLDKIKAALFVHEGKEFYAFYFEQDSTGADYFDESAESLRKSFLKSPLKFSRLTSGYTRRRFHPVQKRWKAHLGTDYAAPTGTPIRSTGDGKIVEARYKKYNGNYVKIQHNSIYMTQYLHMSKINDGIKPGVFVKQGDIIGYVGSTGLATGPHVCYRFWKYGEQVNHLKEEFPPSEPVRSDNMVEFEKLRSLYLPQLEADPS